MLIYHYDTSDQRDSPVSVYFAYKPVVREISYLPDHRDISRYIPL